jgi:hypothetical protein
VNKKKFIYANHIPRNFLCYNVRSKFSLGDDSVVVILFLCGIAVSTIITFFVIKIAMRTAIIEARSMTNVSEEVYMRKQIKVAIIEALQERENKNKEV